MTAWTLYYTRKAQRPAACRRPPTQLDLNELARRLLEDCLNAVMDKQVNELLGEGNSKNRYRERRLNICIRPVTLKIPKLREDIYFLENIIQPHSLLPRLHYQMDHAQ
ncbi:MAG: hypothetical protein QM302_03950 [Acidobacteriota bacterium]|nr:hypothetical protein [Acidobacteriota bacterium]